MENLDVARTLTTLADLLEIQGANPFRIRAYRNAVNTVNSLSRPLTRMVEEGADLTELPGVGKNVAAHIVELFETVAHGFCFVFDLIIGNWFSEGLPDFSHECIEFA